MVFTSKIRAIATTAAVTMLFAGVAHASVGETVAANGTAPSTWIVMISMLAMVGLAGGQGSHAGAADKAAGHAAGRNGAATVAPTRSSLIY